MTRDALDRRTSWALTLGLAVFAAVLQAPLVGWLVEDAGISMAFARNLAEGLGPVPYPGAEPVEGYSNPLWVALLALGYRWGLSGPVVASALGMATAAGAVVVVGQGLRRTLGDWGALWAAVLVAADAQLAIWAQSGLENGLVCLCLAVAVWRLAVPTDRYGAPLAFLALAWTRPEGVAYAAVGLAGHLALTAARVGSGEGDDATVRQRLVALAGPLRGWVLAFALPFVAYHLLRFGLFGMELPATYYAKMGLREPDYLAWDRRQWRYLAEYAVELGRGPVLPLYLVGLLGAGRREGLAAWLGISGVFFAVFALLDDTWGAVRVVTLVAVLTIPAVVGFVRRPWLGVVAALGLVGVAFVVRANGDWMRGFRFVSPVVVPAAVVLSASLQVVFSAVRPLWGAVAGHVAVWLAMGVLVVPQLRYLSWYLGHEETSVAAVRRRAEYYVELAELLRLWRRPIVVDHDMGGQLLYGGHRFDYRDTRGLVDLPFALHKGRPVVVDQLLRDEARELPTFAHVHVHTARALRPRPWFRTGYVEVPGVPTGSGRHDGQFVRREAILGPRFDGRRRRIRYEGVDLVGWRVRSPEVAAGHAALLEVTLERTGPLSEVQLHAFLFTGDQPTATFTIDPGYGLLPARDWKVGEELHGSYVIELPDDLAQGWHDIGLYLTDGAGRPLALTRRVPLPDPLVSANEVRYSNGVRIVTYEEMNAEAAADREKSHDKSEERSCHTAEMAWNDAIAHRAGSTAWRTSRIWKTQARLAGCWANRARRKADDLRRAEPDLRDGRYGDGEEMLLDALDDVLRGRSWDPNEPDVHRAAAKVGALCYARAAAYDRAGQLTLAREWYDRAARANPALAWARRRAEELRAQLHDLPSGVHFGLDEPDPSPQRGRGSPARRPARRSP